MDRYGGIGVVLVFGGGVNLMLGLATGRVFTRWTSSARPERESVPGLFRLAMWLYGLSAALGLGLMVLGRF